MTILSTIPPDVKKSVAKTELAYSKLLDANNNIEMCDYQTGVYYHEPEVIRGEVVKSKTLPESKRTMKENKKSFWNGLKWTRCICRRKNRFKKNTNVTVRTRLTMFRS